MQLYVGLSFNRDILKLNALFPEIFAKSTMWKVQRYIKAESLPKNVVAP